jgi:hypothetical protein
VEPERDIEKELKAYAQQRRAAAGTPPELHPANRNALQAEAAGLAKSKDEKARPWWQTIWSSWPRLAVVGGGVAAVVIIAVLLRPPLNTQNEEVNSFSANGQQRESVKALPQEKKEIADRKLAPATPPPAEPMTLADSSAAKSKAAPVALRDAEVNSPVASAAPAASPAAPPPPALALAVPKKQSATTDSGLASLDSNGAVPGSNHGFAGAPANAPMFSPAIIAANGAVSQVLQPFRRTDAPQKVGKVTGVSNVLASFRVEQDADKLRVIDSDGSIYTGFVAQSPDLAKQAVTAYKLAGEQKDTVADVAADKPPQPVRFYRFRVSGTNRTLKEEIVFTGNFLTKATNQSAPPPSAQFSNEAVGGAVTPVATKVEVLPLELRKSRMEGRLSLGGTNGIEINALPVLKP